MHLTVFENATFEGDNIVTSGLKAMSFNTQGTADCFIKVWE